MATPIHKGRYELALSLAREARGLSLAQFDEAKHPRLHGKFAKKAGEKLGAHDYRFNDDGSFETVGVHNTTPGHAKTIRDKGFDTQASREEGVFGRALYFETAGADHYGDDETEAVHAHVHLKNPLVGNISDLKQALKDVPKSDIAEHLRKNGHDGIILLKKDKSKPHHVMAYDPKQVKIEKKK